MESADTCWLDVCLCKGSYFPWLTELLMIVESSQNLRRCVSKPQDAFAILGSL